MIVIDDAKKYFSYEKEKKDLEKILEDPQLAIMNLKKWPKLN